MGDVIQIRRGLVSDAAALSAAAERWFRETFSSQNTPEDMDAYCAAAFSPDIQRAQLADPSIDTLLLDADNGRLIAYAQLRAAAPEGIVLPAPIELWRFYVDGALHGRGVAQRLMAAVHDAARTRGAQTIWLGVWEKNLRAQAYYRKAGFADIGAHEFHLGDDLQIDRLMSCLVEKGPGVISRGQSG
jgi:ribosomal protein S18 acetylase RimI-like enzyme